MQVLCQSKRLVAQPGQVRYFAPTLNKGSETPSGCLNKFADQFELQRTNKVQFFAPK